MSLDETRRLTRDMYTSNLAEHGPTSRSVGWTTEDGHYLRFEQLAYLVDSEDEPFSVNDFGCGYGGLLEFLRQRGAQVSEYHGYDLSPQMLAAARQQFGDDPRIHLHEKDMVDQTADYSFVSGTFNVRMKSTEAQWRAWIIQTIDQVAQHSRKGFAFNLLSTYVDWKEDHLFYGDPLFFFDHCKKRYGRCVALLHDYPLWEWTLIVRKDSGSGP